MRRPPAVLALLLLCGCASSLSLAPRPVRRETGPAALATSEGLQASGLSVRWKAQVRQGEPVHLHLGRRSAYVETANHEVHALDLSSGFYKWIHPLHGTLQVPPAEAAGDGARPVAYFVSSNRISAVDIEDPTGTGRESGRELWTETLPLAPTTPPSATDFYLGIGTADGYVQVFRLREAAGKAGLERVHQKAWHFDAGGEVRAAPLLPADSADQVLGAGAGGVILSRHLHDGSVRWRFPRGEALGAISQGLLWDVVEVPAAVAKGQARTSLERTLYVGAADNTFQILDPEGGVLLSRLLVSGPVEQKPLVASRVVPGAAPDWTVVREAYCLTREGQLFCFRIRDAHKALRDESGQPVKDPAGAVAWETEQNDGDDVFGGEIPLPPEELSEDVLAEEEELGIRRPRTRLYPIRWEPKELWKLEGIARVVRRTKSGLLCVGTDGELKLVADGAVRWSWPMTGILDLPQPVDPSVPGPVVLLDGTGTVWCLEEK